MGLIEMPSERERERERLRGRRENGSGLAHSRLVEASMSWRYVSNVRSFMAARSHALPRPTSERTLVR